MAEAEFFRSKAEVTRERERILEQRVAKERSAVEREKARVRGTK